MLASKHFKNILKQIQISGLNCQLQASPFGALISLKKSLVKDKKGDFIIPLASITSGSLSSKEECNALASKNVELENKLNAMQNDYASALNDRAAAHKAVEAITQEKDSIRVLEREIKVLKNKIVKLETDAGTVEKKAVYGYQNNTTEREKNKAKENLDLFDKIETEIEMDINYNVKVSNSFSPLLQLLPEKSSPSSQAPTNDLQSSLRTYPLPASWNSPQVQPCSPTSPRTSSDVITSDIPSTSAPESPQTPRTSSEANEVETVLFEGGKPYK